MIDELLDRHDVKRLRADNPGPFTLSGTNTWVVGRDPCWVVDPGPALASHMEAVSAEVMRRGGAAAIALTHDHADHSEGVGALRRRLGGEVPVAAKRHAADVAIDDGDELGPFQVLATPGHAPDHVAFVAEAICFTGDAILGEGSVFVAPDPGAMAGYLQALERLSGMELVALCPGHGAPVGDPRAKIGEYIAHRRDRERRLVGALAAGRRSIDELLDDVWAEVPAMLRPAATVTLAAHLDKLADEDRLPHGVQRPRRPE